MGQRDNDDSQAATGGGHTGPGSGIPGQGRDRQGVGKRGAEPPGGVRQQDGPEPYEDDGQPGGAGFAGTEPPGVPAHSGYEESGPGRGVNPGPGRGGSSAPPGEEDDVDARSRWRNADPDEASERWKDEPGENT